MSAAFIETSDRGAGNAGEEGFPCPEVHQDGLRCDLIKGQLDFEVEAFTVPPPPDIEPFNRFFRVAGGATVIGNALSWDSEAWSRFDSRVPLWEVEDFDFVVEDLDGAREGLVVMTLRAPRTFTVDLSSLEVGQEFTLRSFAAATAYNRLGAPRFEFGSSATAFLRDPQGIDGTTVSFSGLEPIDDPGVAPPVEAPVAPAPCESQPDPDPAAGEIQFSAASYTLTEANPTPTVTVTRTGGSTGAVTATISTSDGSAVAGTDYTPVNASVFFADGDAAPRVVEVPIVQDLVAGEPDKTVNLTLSEPGGCAALGSPTTTQLTIRDNDVAPPEPECVGALDTTFGTEGKATTTAFGGSPSAMALQPDGKIVMVGGAGRFDFLAARFNADGTLDDGFDSDGKVTTDILGGFSPEEALGVAVQPDGKIVVAGAGLLSPGTVLLVRYNPDGSLDQSFGTGGKVISDFGGRASDVTVLPDGKIVVAGTVFLDVGSDSADFLVARYLADGTPDASFGIGGQLATDFGNVSNEAQNIVVQPDGKLVVSGSSRNPGSNGVGIDHHTDIARYQADGQPDPSFGTGGKTTLADTLLGNDLALQGDGRLVLAGTVDVPPAAPTSPTEFSVGRLDSDGSPDLTFGTAGTANVSVSARCPAFGTAERDSAAAVALQGDGKIVVAGKTSNTNANFGLARLDIDGSLDTGFADGGVLVIDFFGFGDAAGSVAMQDDGKIVVSGSATDLAPGYGVARVLP